MSQTAPILIMSSERSGSNLLRTLLSNHDRIAGPMAPQFMSLFPPVIQHFEPLTDPGNMTALLDAMLQVANHKLFSWRLDADPAALMAEHGPRDLVDAFDVLYRAAQQREGAARYVCKENRLFESAPLLMERFPGTRILYLVRDPRDYVLSWQNAPILNNTPYQAACSWRDEQKACLAIEERYGDSVLRVTYEGIVQNPAGSLTRVLEHVGEEVQPECFQVQGGKNKDQEWSSFWKNLTKPVQKGNHAKYREAFDARTLELIETVCADEMQATGYEAETPQAWRKGFWFQRRERKLAAINDARLREKHADTVAVIQDRDRMLREIIEARASVGAHE